MRLPCIVRPDNLPVHKVAGVREAIRAVGASALYLPSVWCFRPYWTARRGHLPRRHIGAVIPTTAQQRRRPGFDRAAYRARNRVERLFNRLTQFRRVAIRCEKRAADDMAMLHIAASPIWIKPFADAA